ncbi:hypothetical protein [Streptomyces sp. NPDC059009]|uniref:hypothetical protein n=1 Tax=Streptomyces sp. NPDC059009 TaxID=3346694 RepID=UPI0036C30C1F
MSTKGRWAARAGVGVAGLGLLLTVGAPPAAAGATGCNDRTCIDVRGSGLTVESVGASTTWNGDFTGHFHIWGGGIDQNSPTQFWGYHQKFTIPVGHDLPNGTVLCAEGWEQVGDHVESRGRACEEVHF